MPRVIGCKTFFFSPFFSLSLSLLFVRNVRIRREGPSKQPTPPGGGRKPFPPSLSALPFPRPSFPPLFPRAGSHLMAGWVAAGWHKDPPGMRCRLPEATSPARGSEFLITPCPYPRRSLHVESHCLGRVSYAAERGRCVREPVLL